EWGSIAINRHSQVSSSNHEDHRTIYHPGLPDDLALRCIAKLSHGYHGKLEGWRDLVRSDAYLCY
ncbi:unnamed protein product, partial [Brassica oleracea]